MTLPARNTSFKTDPLEEYKWTGVNGFLSEFVDEIWIYGGPDMALTSQILIPQWKACLAIVRKWSPSDQTLKDVQLMVFGPITKARPHTPEPGTEIIAARLWPETVANLLDLPLSDISDQDIDGRHLPGFDAVIRAAEMGQSQESVARALLEGIALNASTCRSVSDTTHAAASFIRASHGMMDIGRIADKLDISDRALRRNFKSDLTLSPKKYARLIRLKSVLFSADERQHPDWSGLAHEFGYFDQSHLTEDVRKLTGQRFSSLHQMRRARP